MSVIERDNGRIEYSGETSILKFKENDDYTNIYPTEQANGVVYNTNSLRLSDWDYDIHIQLEAETVDTALTEIGNRVSEGGRKFTEISGIQLGDYNIKNFKVIYYNGSYYMLRFGAYTSNLDLSGTLMAISSSSDGITWNSITLPASYYFTDMCVFNSAIWLVGYQLQNNKLIPKAWSTTDLSTFTEVKVFDSTLEHPAYFVSNSYIACGDNSIMLNMVSAISSVIKTDIWIGSLQYINNAITVLWDASTHSTYDNGANEVCPPRCIGDNIYLKLNPLTQYGLIMYTYHISYSGSPAVATSGGITKSNITLTIPTNYLTEYDKSSHYYYGNTVDSNWLYTIYCYEDDATLYMIDYEWRVPRKYNILYCNGKHIYNPYDTATDTYRTYYGANDIYGKFSMAQPLQFSCAVHNKIYGVGESDNKIYYSNVK